MIPDWATFYQSVKAGLGSIGTTVTGFTFFGGGTTVAVMYNVGAGPDQAVNFTQGVDYVGVPGPELAAGLPVLAIAVAYSAYRIARQSRSAATA